MMHYFYLSETFYNSSSSLRCLSLFPGLQNKIAGADEIGGDFIMVLTPNTSPHVIK